MLSMFFHAGSRHRPCSSNVVAMCSAMPSSPVRPQSKATCWVRASASLSQGRQVVWALSLLDAPTLADHTMAALPSVRGFRHAGRQVVRGPLHGSRRGPTFDCLVEGPRLRGRGRVVPDSNTSRRGEVTPSSITRSLSSRHCPLHRELATGTLRGVLRQAGLTSDDLRRWLWANRREQTGFASQNR